MFKHSLIFVHIGMTLTTHLLGRVAQSPVNTNPRPVRQISRKPDYDLNNAPTNNNVVSCRRILRSRFFVFNLQHFEFEFLSVCCRTI